jgi:hypothetical protein
MLEKVDIEPAKSDIFLDQELEAFLMQSPTFLQKQLDAIAETRESINKWREKPSDYERNRPL